MHSQSHKHKILAIASFGGHLVQLLRIMQPLSETCDISYVSTCEKAKNAVGDANFYVVDDYSRTSPLILFRSISNFKKILRNERPDAVITTGAAPGLSAIIAAKLMGIRTMWIDSIANADKLSMSGRLATRIADKTLTQWPHLAKGKVEFAGNVIDY